MKLQVLVLFILLNKVMIAQEAIKSWNIDPYTIQLFKYEQITEDVGMKIRPYGEIRSYYHLFDISKNSSNFQLSGHIRVNKDSSKLAFIELEKPRKTEGILGYDVLVNLQAKTVKINPISKPKWLLKVFELHSTSRFRNLQQKRVQRRNLAECREQRRLQIHRHPDILRRHTPLHP